MEKFYAAFNETKEKEIAAFPTEQERDNWVNFKDEFSKEFDVTSENAVFSRISLAKEKAEKRITEFPYTYPDDYNENQIWHCK